MNLYFSIVMKKVKNSFHIVNLRNLRDSDIVNLIRLRDSERTIFSFAR